MFNLFKRINEGNKSDCYLIKSGVFEQKILDDDKLEHYNNLLCDEEIPKNFKDLILYFLIPYKISILKYSLNKEYFADPFPYDLHNKHKHIAPSLTKIKENQFDIPMGYPSWFFIAFPDVALWVMKGEGIQHVKKRIKDLSEEDLFDGNHIRTNFLHDFIKLYQTNTNKPLECKKF